MLEPLQYVLGALSGSVVGFTFTPSERDPDDVLGGRRV